MNDNIFGGQSAGVPAGGSVAWRGDELHCLGSV